MPSAHTKRRATGPSSKPRSSRRRPATAVRSEEILGVLVAMRDGDFSARMPVDRIGMGGKIADTLNQVIELNRKLAAELRRLSNVVGKEGRISQRASLTGASGA